MNDTAASRVSCRLYPPVFSTVFWSVSPILLCHTQPFWITSCGRCQKCTLIFCISWSHALATLVTFLVFTSSLRRIRLAAERVDVDTEILRRYGMGRHTLWVRAHKMWNSCSWERDGSTEPCSDLDWWLLFPTIFVWRKLAMRLSRDTAFGENGDPVDLESISSVHGGQQLGASVPTLSGYADHCLCGRVQ